MEPDPKPPAYEAPRSERATTASTTETEIQLEQSRHDPYAAFRFRAFALFAPGSFIAVIGRLMMSVAVNWEVYQRTHSPAALGVVGLALAIPVIAFALPAGHLADRISRRQILVVTQLISAAGSLALGAIAWWQGDIRLLFLVLCISGVARAFGWAARAAFISQLVPAKYLGNAVTWNSTTFQIGSVSGPAIAGLLISKYGVPAAYLFDAVCQLGFYVLLLLIEPRPLAARIENSAAAPAGLAGLFSGMSFVWSTKIILATITLDLFAVLFGGATALLPIYADQILNAGAVGLGWLRAAPSMGAFVMGLALAHLPPLQRPGKSLLWAVAGFGGATMVFGISRSFCLSMAMLALSGAFDTISVIVRHTLLQLLTPDDMRGRVSAVNNVFIGSSNEIGAFESGMTAAWFGPVISVVGGAAATILSVLAVARLWPEVMKLGPLSSVKPQS